MSTARFVHVVLKADDTGRSGWPLMAFGNDAAANTYINSLTDSSTAFGLEPGTYFVQAIRLVEGVGFPPGNGQTIEAETC